MHTIKLGSIEIVVTRKKIKNLRLTVSPPDGRVRISSPLRARDKDIESFALSRIEWIERQQKRFQSRTRPLLVEHISGESHSFQGKRYILEVRYEEKKPDVFIQGDTLFLCVRPGSTSGKREKVLDDWYRSVLKNQIPILIEKWSAIVGDSPVEWGVRNMKTRWGSCNTVSKRIWLSLNLAEKSVECLEYVVVHEMVHLLERGHGKPFISQMDRVLPEWRILKDDLNRYQSIN